VAFRTDEPKLKPYSIQHKNELNNFTLVFFLPIFDINRRLDLNPKSQLSYVAMAREISNLNLSPESVSVFSPGESIAERPQKKDLEPASSTWSCSDIATRHKRGAPGEVELDLMVKTLSASVMQIGK
jgi:hypothetical protein